jgi:hypothetical protein
MSGTTKKYAVPTQVAGNVYKLDFSANALPAYETTLYVDSVSDYSSNVNSVKEYKVNATVDQTRPQVNKVSFANQTLTVTFDKAVTATRANFAITESDGDIVTVLAATPAVGSGNKVYNVTFYNTLGADTYTAKVTGVRDNTALQNTMLDYSTTFSVDDSGQPSISGNPSVNNATRSVVITFSESMDLASISNAANYFINYSANESGVGTVRALPAGATIRPVQDGKAVLITFPRTIDGVAVSFPTTSAPATGTVKSITVTGVKDAIGNILSGYSQARTLIEGNAGVTSYDAGSYGSNQAVQTGSKTIKVKFNQAIGTVNASDFIIAGNTITSAVADSTDVVVLTLGTATTDSTTITNLEVKVANAIKTVNGNSVDAATATIYDAVSPAVVAPTTGVLDLSTNKIMLPFGEDLATANQTLYANDLIVTRLSDNAVLAPITGYQTAVTSGDTIQITLTAPANSLYTVKVKSGVQYIVDDNSGNKATESSTYETSALLVANASSLTGATITDAIGTGKDGRSIVNLPAAATGNHFVYLVSADASAVPTPTVGTDLSAWTTVANAGEIAVTDGKNVGIAEVTSTNVAVKFVNVVADNVNFVAGTSAVVTATNTATIATDMTGKTASIVVNVDGTDATHTFTAVLTSWDGSGNEAALISAIAAASNGTVALSTVADVTAVGGKIVITDKATGATVTVTVTGAAAADATTLTGFVGTETNTGTVASN